MKIRLPLALFAALLVAGCGKKDNVPANVAAAAATAPAAPASAPAAAPAPAAAAPAASAPAAAGKASAARVIEITANDQMQFSIKAIEAKVGEELKVVFTNIGTLPKEAMGHNWVLLKAGTDPMAFAAASMTAKAQDYIAPAMKDQVIVHTPILGPKQNAEVTFKVTAAGDYPFLCSFPGHAALMKGTLTAK